MQRDQKIVQQWRLDLFQVRIKNGIVKVDTGRLVRRTAFEPNQVTRA